MEKAQTKAGDLKPNKDARGGQTGGHGGGKTGSASLWPGQSDTHLVTQESVSR